MNQHISLLVGGQPLELPANFSIDFEDVNPYFNEANSFSYDAALPLNGNRHIFKNIEEAHADMRFSEIEHAPMQLLIDGMPFRTGKLQTKEGEEIEETITISMVSSLHSLADIINNLNCRDVPVKDKIQIGEMIGNVLGTFEYYYRFEVISSNPGLVLYCGPMMPTTVSNQIELQALGFSVPAIYQVENETTQVAVKGEDGNPVRLQNFINVTTEYPHAQFCNARACYTHYGKTTENGEETTSEEIQLTDQFGPYYVIEADRPQSGICFYILYFLDCLFNNLSLNLDNEELLEVGDLRRLAFFTTHCKYDAERKFANKAETYDFNSLTEINNWLTSRNTKGELSTTFNESKELDSGNITNFVSGLSVHYKIGDEHPFGGTVAKIQYRITSHTASVKANILNMYANSQNFPDTSVTSLIDSLWNSFGIKFLLDYETNQVTARLVRNIYRSQEAPIVLRCTPISYTPIIEKITGVKMAYSAESSAKEQDDLIRGGETDYDTDFDYKDYSNIKTTESYLDIVKKTATSDTTCYIDLATGNAYRIKVSSDATTASELKPALFEVGGYRGVELGDCSKLNEDYIEELISDLQPMIFTDVNGHRAKNAASSASYLMTDQQGNSVSVSAINNNATQQVLAAFIDEEMESPNIVTHIDNVIGSDHADFFVRCTLSTDEAYDPTSTEDGNSPLQEIDWGMTVAIMRGGGADATIEQYDYDYDGFGSSKWQTVAGEYALTSDSIDNWGNQFDYNGTQTGLGEGERFSLKIRAYKEVDGQILCQDDLRDEQGNVTTKIRSRGLHDTFMAEHTHFLLNRKLFKITLLCQPSQLATIPQNWHRRFTIGHLTGYINKVNSRITNNNGLEAVEIELYTL